MHRKTNDHHQEVAELPEDEEAGRMGETRKDLRPVRHKIEQIPRRVTAPTHNIILS